MSAQFRTHYDNLMVSRTASPEVIAAAYRALSKRLHPDLNHGSPEAERAMRIVNTSYGVLSDPLKRRVHDEWITNRETELIPGSGSTESETKPQQQIHTSRMQPIIEHLSRTWGWYLVVGGIAAAIMSVSPPSGAQSGLPPYDASPAVDPGVSETPQVAAFARPETAPNGEAWPSRAAYVKGYPIARASGLSKLTIDNSSNSTDMFVKLVALDAAKTLPIRHAYIPAYQTFTMNDIRTGRYDVRYMDLSDGSLSRSEEFELEEIPSAGRIQYSVTTMTLYKIANGNMQTYSLDPSEF